MKTLTLLVTFDVYKGVFSYILCMCLWLKKCHLLWSPCDLDPVTLIEARYFTNISSDFSSEIKDQEGRKQQNGEDLAEKKEREEKESGEKDSEEKEEEKDDPHQQSFLSFLNLKKGEFTRADGDTQSADVSCSVP